MKIITNSNCDMSFVEAAAKSVEESMAEGEASGMTLQDIADKHNVSLEEIKKELAAGIEIELEHTSDKKLSRKIAMDHLVEIPDYYSRLKKMEAEAS